MRTALALILIVSLGCGKPTSEPAKPEQVPEPKPTDPKPKDQAEPTPKEITWSSNALNNAPGYLMPYEKSDPEKALEKIQKELPTDKVANDLLKKLLRVETLTFEVKTGPAPKRPRVRTSTKGRRR